MQTATAAYGTIVSGNEITYAIKVTITWPAAVPATYQVLSDLTVEACHPIRETQTDMPAATRYVTGRAAAACDITLSGLLDKTDDTKTIAWLMGQYQSTSPLFRTTALGLPVTVDMGVLTADATMTTPSFEGVEFVRVFTGVIDDYAVNSATGEVTLTCLDNRSRHTGPAQLPPVNTASPYFPLLTGEFAIDALIRPNALTWPAQRANCVLAVGMRGSVWPEVGTVDAAGTFGGTPPALVTGKFGSAVSNLIMAYKLPTPIGGASVLVEAWVDFTDYTNIYVQDGPSSYINQIHMFSGAGSFGVTVSNTGVPSSQTVNWTGGTPPSSGIHYIAFQIVGSTIRLELDTATPQSNALTVTPIGTYTHTLLQISATSSIEALQVTTEAGTAAFNGAFTPTAVLDRSLNSLTALPDVSGQDEWAALQDIATAEQGICGYDELDLFTFRNRHTIQTAASVRTIVADTSLQSLTTESIQASLINHVQVPVNKLQVGPLGWVWSASDVIAVPANGSVIQTISTTTPVVAVAATDSGRAPSGQTPDGNTYWRACKAANGAGPEITSGITVTCVQLAPSQIRMTIKNANSFIAYLCSPIGAGYPSTSNGLPSLMIGGRSVTVAAVAGDATGTAGAGVLAESQYPPLVPDGGAAASARGDKLLTMPANPWRQQVASSQAFSDDLLYDLSSSRPNWNNVVIVADPRLQRGDRVTLADPNVSGMTAEDAIIANIEMAEDWTMTLDLRAIAAPGGWLLGVAGRSELNLTTYVT